MTIHTDPFAADRLAVCGEKLAEGKRLMEQANELLDAANALEYEARVLMEQTAAKHKKMAENTACAGKLIRAAEAHRLQAEALEPKLRSRKSEGT